MLSPPVRPLHAATTATNTTASQRAHAIWFHPCIWCRLRVFTEMGVEQGGLARGARKREPIRHGVSRALCLFNLELRPSLKKAGLLVRDSRMKERKKYGQRGARARFQFSKR